MVITIFRFIRGYTIRLLAKPHRVCLVWFLSVHVVISLTLCIFAVNFAATGSIVQWTVPSDGLYQITAVGAQGCSRSSLYEGCLGASMQGSFSLSAGQTLSILVGMRPCTVTTRYPGGAGGILHKI
jgi:hypothetical protein